MERLKLNIQRFAEDGMVIIKAEMDTSGIDAGVKKIKKEIEDFEKYDTINPYDIDLKDLDEVKQRLKEMSDRYSDMKKQNEEIENILHEVRECIRDAVLQGKTETDEYREQLKVLMEKNDITWDYYKALTQIQNKNQEMMKTQEKNYQILRENALNTASANGNTQGMANIPTDIEGEGGEGASGMAIASAILDKVAQVGKTVLKVVGKVVWSVLKIGAEIAGITLGASFLATIVAALVKAITKILEENKQLMANIKYIVFMVSKMIDNIANAITGKIGGALQGIANIVYMIVVLFGKFLSWLFKIDVFAGITNEAFQEWNKNIQGASSGLESAVGSAKDLKKQLAGFDEMNVLQEPASGGGGGGGGVGVDLPMPDFTKIEDIKIPKWLQWIIDNADIISGVVAMIGGALLALKLGLDPLMGLGIGSILAGIVNLIIDIIDFIKDPTWENFKTLIDDFLIDLALIIGGIAVLTGQWIPGVIAIVMLLAGIIIRYWDEIKEMFSKAWAWIKEKVIDPIANAFKQLWDTIKVVFAPFINFFKELFGKTWENLKIMINNIKIIVDYIAGVLKTVFSAVWEKIKEIFGPVVDWFRDKWEKALAAIKKVFGPIVEWIAGIWNTVTTKLREFGAKIAEVIGGAFKTVINGVIGAIEKVLNFPANAINKLIGKLKDIPGLGGLSYFQTYSLPRLAKGGIINQPGRGVAIGGESGQEGVIPLTDAQMMARLGEAIGKYITINASITNTMNGRVISRELQRLSNEMNFAYNG